MGRVNRSELGAVQLVTGKTTKSLSPIGGAVCDAVLSNDGDLQVVLTRDTAISKVESD
jgi:hypothetical protein